MKILYYLMICFALGASVKAQGTLQFNQALIQGDVQTTVPAGKVWKVTAIYGKESICYNLAPLYTSFDSPALMAGFYVNGVEISSFRKFLSTTAYYTGSNCISSYPYSVSEFTSLNYESDPNILPIWLPAGTTVKTIGPNVFISVLEFNVIP